ncbi:hypothetical protein FRC01_001603 [Tulasnella sp. 417]|nr:hypothetical protein FRC01_001603 [Tulasnella sp. 417]
MSKTINQSLPREILAYIFEVGLLQEQCGDDLENSDSNVGDDHDRTCLEFPVLVSCVCKHWQDVALSTPTLWASVNVCDWTLLKWLEKRISLSKETPLDIQVDLSEDIIEMPEDVMDLLTAEARRWRSFDCTFQSDLTADEILSQFKGIRAPLLEKLALVDDSTSEFVSFYRPPNVYELFDGPGSLPKLRSASLWSVPLEWDNNPFRDLRELELCYIPDAAKPSLSQFLALLQASPQLEVLLICNGAIRPTELEDMPDWSPTSLKSIRLPSLVALTFTDFDHALLLSRTIQLIDAPNLRHLGITDMYEDGDGEETDFSSSIDVLTCGENGRLGSRFPALESLKFAHIHSPSPDVLDRLFLSLAGLKRLHFIFPRVPYTDEMDVPQYLLPFASPETRQRLGRSPLPEKIICPVLEELTIAAREPEDLIWEFAQTRKSSGHPLKRILYDNRGTSVQAQGLSDQTDKPMETEITEYEESDASMSDSCDQNEGSDVDEEDWHDDLDDVDEDDGDWTDEDQAW